MRLERRWWPLVWTTEPRPGDSPVTVFDLIELRSALDTLRVSAGLPPVEWVGRTDGDPALTAFDTPIRAVHFTQIRAALADLYAAADLGPLPEFAGGPIVATTRPIRLVDLLDLRGWVERFEHRRPDLAARIVCRYAPGGADALTKAPRPERLVEAWDAAGSERYGYDDAGRVTRTTRVLDGRAYTTSYEYQGDVLAAIGFPDGERVALPADRTLPVDAADAAPTVEDLVGRHDGLVRRDGLGRVVLVGDPPRPTLRVAYAADGSLAKWVEGAVTTHAIGHHYERRMGPPGDETVDRKYLAIGNGRRFALHLLASAPNAAHAQARRLMKDGAASSPAPETVSRKHTGGMGDKPLLPPFPDVPLGPAPTLVTRLS